MRHAQRQRLSVLHGVSQKPQEEDRQAWSSARCFGPKPTHNTGEANCLEPTTSPEARGPGRSVEGVPYRIVVSNNPSLKNAQKKRIWDKRQRSNGAATLSIRGTDVKRCHRLASTADRKSG